MKFRAIAYKNFKANIKKYFVYLLCSSFAIMIFFMYTTLIFNTSFSQHFSQPGIKGTIGISLMVVGIFSLFFITYAHNSFMKSRNKELGILLSLGMTDRDIGKMIRIENSLIAFLSLGTGLFTGTVFSRLFFMTVVKLLDVPQITFQLSRNSYLLTIGLFCAIFLFVILWSRLFTKKFEVIDFIKESRRAERKKGSPLAIGVTGLVLMIGTMTTLYFHVKGRVLPNRDMLPLFIIALNLVGIYFIISGLGSLFIGLSKKFQEIYYRNLLTIKGINYKFSQSRKIIFVITILTAVVILALGSVYSSYLETMDVVEESQPYDLMIIDRLEDNEKLEGEIEQVIESYPVEVREKHRLEFIESVLYKEFNGIEGKMIGIPVISAKQFQDLTDKKLELQKGEALILRRGIAVQNQQDTIEQEEIKLDAGHQSYVFRSKGYIYGSTINSYRGQSFRMIILHHQDFEGIKAQLEPRYVGLISLYNFNKWKAIKGIEEKIQPLLVEAIMGDENEKTFDWNEVITVVTSKIIVYERIKQENAFTLFLMSFIGLLFFITSGSILYLKLFSEIDQMKIQYKALFRLGIQKKEMEGIIAKELKFLFFIPFTLGVLVGYVYMGLITINTNFQQSFLTNGLYVVGIYFIFQTIYYTIAKGKHVKEVLSIDL